MDLWVIHSPNVHEAKQWEINILSSANEGSLNETSDQKKTNDQNKAKNSNIQVLDS